MIKFRNTNSIYSLFAALFFLSVFFVGAKNVKADDCSDCAAAYNGDITNCSDYCGGSTLGPQQTTTSSCDNDYSTSGCCETNGGYWYNNTCNTSPNESSSGGGCNPGCEGGEVCINSTCVSSASNDSLTCKIDEECISRFGSGYKCNNGSCEVDSVVGSECQSNSDCVRLNGIGSQCTGLVKKTCTAAPASAEDQAAAKKESQAATAAANSSAANLNNAKNNVNAANALAASCGNDAAACAKAAAAQAKANEELLAAQADFDSKISAANAAAVAAGASTSTGAGFSMCANGIIGTVCSGGGGTPIVLGASNGLNLGGGGGYSSSGFNGVSTPKCGTNFSEIGGVCFPTNTGLSSAPISSILANIFSWIMGLFTTLAIAAFVISGIQYLTAAGDSSRMEEGKKNATYAIMGIIVGLSGFIIIKAVAAALSGQGYFF